MKVPDLTLRTNVSGLLHCIVPAFALVLISITLGIIYMIYALIKLSSWSIPIPLQNRTLHYSFVVSFKVCTSVHRIAFKGCTLCSWYQFKDVTIFPKYVHPAMVLCVFT